MVECRTFWRRGVRRDVRREVRRGVPLKRLATFSVVPSTMGISLTAPSVAGLGACTIRPESSSPIRPILIRPSNGSHIRGLGLPVWLRDD